MTVPPFTPEKLVEIRGTLSQREVAELLHTTKDRISQCERGYSRPDRPKPAELSQVEWEWLLLKRGMHPEYDLAPKKG